jgi:hypothetical protein
MHLAQGTEKFSTNKVISAGKNPGALLNKVVYTVGEITNVKLKYFDRSIILAKEHLEMPREPICSKTIRP